MSNVIPPERQRNMAKTDEERTLEAELRRYPPLLTWVQRVVSHLDEYEEHGLRTAGDLLGARAYLALTALLGEHTDEWLHDSEARLAVARSILEAVPVLWPGDLLDAARELALPEHVVSPEVMPYPLMWWSLSRARGPEAEVESLLLGQGEDGISVIVYGAPDERGRLRAAGPIDVPFHRRWPDDFNGDSNVEMVLQLLAFMNSRYVEDAVEQLPRAERRRIERAALPTDALDGAAHAHIIRLRAPEPGIQNGSPSGETGRRSRCREALPADDHQ